MLKSLSKEIRDCHAHAENCEERAETALNAEMRKDFLRLRDSWLNLARSYEFAEQLLDYTRENARWRQKWQSREANSKTNGGG